MTTPFPRLVNPLGMRSLYSAPPDRLGSAGFLLARFNEHAGLAVKFAGPTCGSVISLEGPTTWVLFANELVSLPLLRIPFDRRFTYHPPSVPQHTFSCTNDAINGPEIAQNSLDICDYWSQNMARFVTRKERVRQELRQKIAAKYLEKIELIFARVLPADAKDKKARSRMIRTGPAKNGIPRLVAKLKHVPDHRLEAVMAMIDSMDPLEMMRLVLTTGLAQLPKKHGGRPAKFSLDVRRKAVQDIGNEYPGYDRLSDAIDVVAARHGMTPEYLRKVWKNRKRLRGRNV